MFTFILCLALSAFIQQVSARPELILDSYPARVHENSPPDTLVLTITGYDNATGRPLEKLSMTDNSDASYFKIVPTGKLKWFISTKKLLDKPENYTFEFRVLGLYDGTIRDREVKIIVSAENLYAPYFRKNIYKFVALRNSLDHGLKLLGHVSATDQDNEGYNSIFRYFIFDSMASKYFKIDPKEGQIGIISNFPSNMSEIAFNVTAIDSGSPIKSGTTQVYVQITDLAPPEIFCVSVEGTTARICWKDNTNGSNVDHYQLQFAINGQNVTSYPVGIAGKRDEVCTQVRAGKLRTGNRLKFTIKVFNKTHWSPESVERFVNITKDGLYGDCPKFSNCSVYHPCQNKGVCKTDPDLSYKCQCAHGWAGQNCTEVDKCITNPCLNGASCQFVSDAKFRCKCPSDFYGNLCQFRDKCVSSPCRNNGSCYKMMNGSFHCQCPENFKGSLCENMDYCYSNPCQNGGLCKTNVDNFSCDCKFGFLGPTCDIRDVCLSEKPCNHGNCSILSDGSYECVCDLGFIGVNCTVKDKCRQDMCENNSTCVAGSDSDVLCSCLDGYYGNRCQYYNKCRNDPCQNSGICSTEQDGSFTCSCEKGYYGDLCQHYNPCVSEPCQFGGICRNMSNSTYTCTCVVERFGDSCEFINGCNLNLCQNNASCTNISTNGSVECSCIGDFFGAHCDRFNPCLSNPCEHAGICQNLTNNGYLCHCPTGWTGQRCQYEDKCITSSPCENHATCHTHNNSFHCDCKTDFYGERCTKYDFCTAGTLCRNGANCDVLDVPRHQVNINGTSANLTNWYNCSCPHGYTGIHCDIEVKACDPNPCGRGFCQEVGSTHVCICPDGTKRDTCRRDLCEAEDMTFDRTGRYHWPRTLVGVEALSFCPLGPSELSPHAFAIRKCQVDHSGKPRWLLPVTKGCRELSEEEADRRLLGLMNITDDASVLTPEQVSNITTDLENVAIFATKNEVIAKELTTVISNLLETREAVLIESDHKNHSSKRLVELLNEYADSVETPDTATIATENINLVVVNISSSDKKDFSYKQNMKENKTDNIGVELQIPGEVLKSSSKKGMKLQIITYRTSAFFIPEIPTPEEIVLKQRVLSATVQGVKIENLRNPIHYTLPNIEHHANHTCVFWNHNKWSTKGVHTVSTGGNETNCYTTHLTSFAVILDPTPSLMLPDVHEKALTYISYIGCAVSIFGLAFTIVTYSIFRSLNRERSGKILLNMCVSMLLMNASFILMAETTKSEGVALCTITAILLHYFLLTSLMWMCTEAVNMYQALIKVFTTYSSYFILKRCLVAWGVPLVVIAVTMGINKLDNYKTKTDFCFISQANTTAFYIALLGPACVILVINTVVFTLVARVIMKPRFKGSIGKNEKEKVSPAQVRGAFTVMVLLGVTWVFGPVAINESKIVFNYLFTILNSLQGFLIFVFRCLLNTEARSAWVLLIKTGTFKRRRGPIVSNHESCSKGFNESKGNGSMADSTVHTGRTILNNSNENLHHKNGHKSQEIMTNGKPGKHDAKTGFRTNGLVTGKRHSDEYELKKEFDDLTKL